MVSIANKYLVYWLAMLFVLIPLGSSSAAEIPIIDAHSQVDQHISLEEILSLMDDAGVSHTILAPRGQRRAKDLISFAKRHPGRITPAVRTKGGAYLKGPKQFNRFLNKQIQTHQFGAMAEVLMWHAEKRKVPNVNGLVRPQSKFTSASSYIRADCLFVVLNESIPLQGSQRKSSRDHRMILRRSNVDGFVKSRKTPSPSKGEGKFDFLRVHKC